MNGLKPICPYCGKQAVLVTGETIYPHRADLFDLKFWNCAPCEAYVGCHKPNIMFGDGTRPLGRLANAELRTMKSRAHAAFDALWKGGVFKNRGKAYAWLAIAMSKRPEDTHIGEFDVEECRQVIRLSIQRMSSFHEKSEPRARQ